MSIPNLKIYLDFYWNLKDNIIEIFLKEHIMAKYLDTLNPNNKIFVFVLIILIVVEIYF